VEKKERLPRRGGCTVAGKREGAAASWKPEELLGPGLNHVVELNAEERMARAEARAVLTPRDIEK
jgi:hypothetical protein